jgi:hypothetical protein
MGRINDGQVVVDFPHHNIHKQRSFIVSDYDSDVDIAGPKYYRFTTPNTDIQVHFTFQVFGNAAGTVEFYENPTINAAGSAMTAYNMYRHGDSVPDATLLVKYDSTTTSDGTRIFIARVGTTGIPVETSGGSVGSRLEFVLKKNEDYILKFTSDADNNKLWVDFIWYEVLEK